MAFYRAKRASGGGGGAYSSKFYNDGSAMSGSASLTNLTVGKNYLVLVYGANSAANLLNTYYDGCTCTNGTLTKLRNMVTVGARRMAGTVYNFKPTGTGATITLPNSGWVQVWEN